MKKNNPRWADDEGGSAIVELALSLPLLTFLLVTATDYALERVAEIQTQSAVIAATEYAATKGCIALGIKAAAAEAVDTSFNRWFVSNLTVSSTSFCACGFSDPSPSLLVPVGASGDAPACSSTYDVCTVGGINIPAVPYVTITATANYAPLVPRLWGASSHPISTKATVRTFGTQSACNG